MRVTQNMMNTQMLANLSANNNRMQQYQNQLATGKRLNKPSDDPVGVGFAMRYEAQVSKNVQYQSNVDNGIGMLKFMDTSLNQVNTVLQRARELALQGASDSMSPDSRSAIADEIHQLYEQLVTIGDAQYNGDYAFNGQLTDIAPYTSANAPYAQTDTGQVVYTMSEGVNIPVNATGEEVFGKPTTPGNEATSDNAFAVLKSLETALLANNGDDVRAAVGRIDTRMNAVLSVWADVGARLNRTEMIDARLKDLDLNIQELLSKTVDADIPLTITHLKMAESVQRASLDVGARIIQPSLMDFLR